MLRVNINADRTGPGKIQTMKEIHSYILVKDKYKTGRTTIEETYFSRILKYPSKEMHEWNKQTNKKRPEKYSVAFCYEIHIHVCHNLSEELMWVLEGCYSIFSHILSPEPPSVNN